MEKREFNAIKELRAKGLNNLTDREAEKLFLLEKKSKVKKLYRSNEIIDAFIDYTSFTYDKSSKTSKAYVGDIKLFLQYIYESKNGAIQDVKSIDIDTIKDISFSDINGYLQHLSVNNNHATSTKNRKTVAIKEFYKFLEAVYNIPNITNSLKTKKIKSKMKEELVVLNKEEEKSLLSAPNPRSILYKRDRALIVLMLKCGLRVEEVEELDYDYTKHNLEEKSELRFMGKGEKWRDVPVNESNKKILLDYINSVNLSGERLFTIKKRAMQHSITKYARLIGRNDISCHSLRHTFGTRLDEMGVSSFMIANLMGHTSIETTKIYIHNSKEDKHNVIAKIS